MTHLPVRSPAERTGFPGAPRPVVTIVPTGINRSLTRPLAEPEERGRTHVGGWGKDVRGSLCGRITERADPPFSTGGEHGHGGRRRDAQAVRRRRPCPADVPARLHVGEQAAGRGDRARARLPAGHRGERRLARHPADLRPRRGPGRAPPPRTHHRPAPFRRPCPPTHGDTAATGTAPPATGRTADANRSPPRRRPALGASPTAPATRGPAAEPPPHPPEADRATTSATTSIGLLTNGGGPGPTRPGPTTPLSRAPRVEDVGEPLPGGPPCAGKRRPCPCGRLPRRCAPARCPRQERPRGRLGRTGVHPLPTPPLAGGHRGLRPRQGLPVRAASVRTDGAVVDLAAFVSEGDAVAHGRQDGEDRVHAGGPSLRGDRLRRPVRGGSALRAGGRLPVHPPP